MTTHNDANVGQSSARKALVVVAEQCSAQTSAAFASDAGFLAQLLACRAGIGSYRRNRREEPSVASGLYRASNGRTAALAAEARRTLKIA